MWPDRTYPGKCKGTNKDGSACKHRKKLANGFCFQHGGATPPEVIREELRRISQRMERRIKKWKRRLNIKDARK